MMDNLARRISPSREAGPHTLRGPLAVLHQSRTAAGGSKICVQLSSPGAAEGADLYAAARRERPAGGEDRRDRLWGADNAAPEGALPGHSRPDAAYHNHLPAQAHGRQ